MSKKLKHFVLNPLDGQHVDLISKWRNHPHVYQNWGGPKAHIQIRKEIESLVQNDKTNAYVVYYQSRPIGFMQSYQALPDKKGWWPNEPRGTWGIDFFIGESEFLRKGLGSQLVKEFSDHLLKSSSVLRIIADPAFDNEISHRTLKRAGFHQLRPISTPDGKSSLFHKLKAPFIETSRTLGRLGHSDDIEEVIRFHQDNEKDHFARWNPEYPPNFLTKSFWKTQISKSIQAFHHGQSMRLMFFHRQSNELMAMINFTNFERASFQNCRLGYKIGKKYEGQGLMREALEASIQYLFRYLQFHRIEANVIPNNDRSRNLLRRLQFEEIGISKNYLRINSQWQDHVLHYLNNPFWRD